MQLEFQLSEFEQLACRWHSTRTASTVTTRRRKWFAKSENLINRVSQRAQTHEIQSHFSSGREWTTLNWLVTVSKSLRASPTRCEAINYSTKPRAKWQHLTTETIEIDQREKFSTLRARASFSHYSLAKVYFIFLARFIIIMKTYLFLEHSASCQMAAARVCGAVVDECIADYVWSFICIRA